MSDYIPLKPRLEGHWSKPLADLPVELQEVVRSAFGPVTWDMFAVEQRKAKASDHDFYNDPANDAEIEWTQNFFSELLDLNTRRNRLEEMVPKTPLDMESQVRQLAEIDARLAAIDAELRAGFKGGANPSETKKQRDARLVKRVKALRASGALNPTQQAVVEFGLTESYIRRILRAGKPPQKNKKRHPFLP